MAAKCPLPEVKRTLLGNPGMSAYDPKRTCNSRRQMSAFEGKADMTLASADVC
jgi:hypothetical protein